MALYLTKMSIISLSYLTLVALNLLFIAYVWMHYKIARPYICLFAFYLSIALLEFASEVIFAKLKNNLFLYHIQLPIEYLTISLLFLNILIGHQNKIICYSLLALLLVATLMDVIAKGNVSDNNDIPIILKSLFVIILCLLYLRQLMTQQIDVRAQENEYFWIVCALFAYYIGQLFFEGFLGKLIPQGEDKARRYYLVSFYTKYISCILTLYSILLYYRKAKSIDRY
jgi:hypothetical protein